MTLSIMTLSVTTLSIMTLNLTTVSVTTLSIMTLSIMTLSIIGSFLTLIRTVFRAIMLCVAIFYCYAEWGLGLGKSRYTLPVTFRFPPLT